MADRREQHQTPSELGGIEGHREAEHTCERMNHDDRLVDSFGAQGLSDESRLPLRRGRFGAPAEPRAPPMPGPIDSEMLRGFYSTDALRAERLAAVPMARFGQRTEVAAAVVFLASDECPYMTGGQMAVDGGSLVH